MKQKAPRSTLRLALTQRLRLSWGRWQEKRQIRRLEKRQIQVRRMQVELDSLLLLTKQDGERLLLTQEKLQELQEIQDFRLEGRLNPRDLPELEASQSVKAGVS